MKEIIQTRNEKERERDEIKENNKLLKKIIENDGKLQKIVFDESSER